MSLVDAPPAANSWGPDEQTFADGATTRGRVGLGRIVAGYSLVGLTWAITFLGSLAVLVPAKLAVIDPENKTADLSALVLFGAVISLLSNVLFGALSDRTRTRLGARNPWLLAGGAIASLGMVILGIAPGIAVLAIGWAVLNVGQTAFLSSVLAAVADRVAPRRQGLVSGVMGTSTTIAQSLGAIIAAQFVLTPDIGFWALAPIPVVGVVAIVLLIPDNSNVGAPRLPITATTFTTVFAFPRNAPDFYWALFGRLLIVVSFFMILSYQFFILIDYMKLAPASASSTISTAGLFSLVAGVVAGLLAGPVSDRLNRRKVPIYVASVLLAVGALAPFLIPEPGSLVFFSATSGFGLGIYWAVDAALVLRVLPNPLTVAKDLGLLAMANTGGQVIAPIIVAVVVAAAGYRPVFLIAAACAVVGAILIVPIRSVR